MDRKYDPFFREIRDCLRSDALDREICSDWEKYAVAENFRQIRSGFRSFSDLTFRFDHLFNPWYGCRFIGAVPELESYAWGSFFPTPEQELRFRAELRLHQEGKTPVSGQGAPWLFQRGTGRRAEASAEQKQKLFALFDLTEQTVFAAQYGCPPAGSVYPRARVGRMYGDGLNVFLEIPLGEPLLSEKAPGQTFRLPLPDGSAAVLTCRQAADGGGRIDAVGYVENYTRQDAPKQIRLQRFPETGKAQLVWTVEPGEADGRFLLYDRTLAHWAPFLAWFDGERRALEQGSAERIEQKGKALMEALYRASAEG
jgi:hypothetical protein